MDTENVEQPVEAEVAPAPRPKAPPIESRFLFVDVAAMRAKQLRRGALVRIDESELAEMQRVTPHKQIGRAHV